MEAPGDHEVQDEPEVVVETDGDSLADSAQFPDGLAFDAAQWWVDTAQQKGAGEAHMFEWLAEDPLFEGFDVDDDVGQFGHCPQINLTSAVCPPVQKLIRRLHCQKQGLFVASNEQHDRSRT